MTPPQVSAAAKGLSVAMPYRWIAGRPVRPGSAPDGSLLLSTASTPQFSGDTQTQLLIAGSDGSEPRVLATPGLMPGGILWPRMRSPGLGANGTGTGGSTTVIQPVILKGSTKNRTAWWEIRQ